MYNGMYCQTDQSQCSAFVIEIFGEMPDNDNNVIWNVHYYNSPPPRPPPLPLSLCLLL